MLLLQPLLTVLVGVTTIQCSPISFDDIFESIETTVHSHVPRKLSFDDIFEDIKTTVHSHESRDIMAKPQLLKLRGRAAVKDLKNFQIPNIFTTSFSGVSGDNLNRTITFDWKDINSNSSTICTTQWLNHSSNSTASQKATGVGYPTNYVFCNNNNPNHENWQWYFSSMTNMSTFQLTLAHEYIDPDTNSVGPAPYDSLQVFAKFNASLTCTTKSGYQSCYLPPAQSPGNGIIYGFSA